jgi:cyclopropane fatty-acyl-phospholipid synthase-like methyltransferase
MDDLSRLYDNLSRYTYYSEWLRKRRRPDFLSMHKPMLIPVGDRGLSKESMESEDLDALCYRLARLPENPAVLDVGCGFGTTLFKWQLWKNGCYHGYTNSKFQLKVTRNIAERRDVTDRCRFYLKSFEDKIDGQYDAVIGIEALIHARNTPAVLDNISGALRPGGRIIIVDDFLRKPQTSQTKYYQILKESWYLSGLFTLNDFLEAVSGSGLDLIEHKDLSKLVPLSPPGKISFRLKWLGGIRRLIPFAGMRLFLRTHQGGYALQQLYREELMGYHLIVARKPF